MFCTKKQHSIQRMWLTRFSSRSWKGFAAQHLFSFCHVVDLPAVPTYMNVHVHAFLDVLYVSALREGPFSCPSNPDESPINDKRVDPRLEVEMAAVDSKYLLLGFASKTFMDLMSWWTMP